METSGGSAGAAGGAARMGAVAAGVASLPESEQLLARRGGQQYERRPVRSAKQEESHDPVETTG